MSTQETAAEPAWMRTASLAQVENRYRHGVITFAELAAYLRKWNDSAHFTRAVWADGAIRQFDPEQSPGTARHYFAAYPEFFAPAAGGSEQAVRQ